MFTKKKKKFLPFVDALIFLNRPTVAIALLVVTLVVDGMTGQKMPVRTQARQTRLLKRENGCEKRKGWPGKRNLRPREPIGSREGP